MNLFAHYQTELKRIAWRMQYHVRKERKKETLSALEIIVPVDDFSFRSIENITLQHLLDNLSSPIGQEIIYQIYILGRTEKEVATSLNITQQGVNKWKNKMLKELRTMSN
ncbi:hypothetical protein [Paenibacillus sp. Z6-24]